MARRVEDVSALASMCNRCGKGVIESTEALLYTYRLVGALLLRQAQLNQDSRGAPLPCRVPEAVAPVEITASSVLEQPT